MVGVCNQLLNPNSREAYSPEFKWTMKQAASEISRIQAPRAKLASDRRGSREMIQNGLERHEIAVPERLGIQDFDRNSLSRKLFLSSIGPLSFGPGN